MNILLIKPKSHIIMDSDVYGKGLRQLGHTVNEININPNKKSLVIPSKRVLQEMDLIWCPYEQELDLGLWLKDKLNIPIVGHFEWIPPWRCGAEDFKQYGYTDEDKEEIKYGEPIFTKQYKRLLDLYLKCDILTTPTDYCFSTLKQFHDFTEEELSKVRIKPYIVDNERLLNDIRDDISEENSILTIGRLVPHKKIGDIIKALALVKSAPKLKIMGFGIEQQKLEQLADKLNVNVEFVGSGELKSKTTEIQKAMFLVTPFASLPAGEAAMLKKGTILYDHYNVKEKHGNIGKYVEFNNVEKLAEAIQDWVDNPKKAKAEGQKSYDNLVDNKSGLKTIKNSCLEMIKIFEEVTK